MKKKYVPEVALLVMEQLMKDDIHFTAIYVAKEQEVEINLLDNTETPLYFKRGENYARYWLEEAPYRKCPYNSTDDYDMSKYP